MSYDGGCIKAQMEIKWEEHIHVQMRLPRALRISDPLLEDLLRLLDKLPVQIYRVPVHAAHRIVFPENIVRGLFVVLVHHCAVALAFFGELVRRTAVTAVVGIVGLVGGGVSQWFVAGRS